MNDFTKEELEILSSLASSKESSMGNKPYKYLSDKIQSMIDNYCEHDPEGDYHVCVDKCKKCKKFIIEQ